MLFMDALFNSLLVVSSGYALYTLHPLQTPYAYTAASCSLLHGLMGVMRATKGDRDECSRMDLISTTIMDIAPVPLVNIELYLRSSNPQLALAHATFVVPLVYDVLSKLNDRHDAPTDTLKELTLLGNIVSLLFLGVNQVSNLYGAMAAMAFGARYGSAILNYYSEGLGNEFKLIANSANVVFLTMSLTSK